jgi:hypothetical protein
MNCDAAIELIEPFAAGDLEASDELRAHFEVCRKCASELEVARRVNHWLMNSSVQAPRHFTANVLQGLPPLKADSRDELEPSFETIAVLSLLPVLAGVWLLADPARLQHLASGTMLMAYTAISLAAVLAIFTVHLTEDG